MYGLCWRNRHRSAPATSGFRRHVKSGSCDIPLRCAAGSAQRAAGWTAADGLARCSVLVVRRTRGSWERPAVLGVSVREARVRREMGGPDRQATSTRQWRAAAAARAWRRVFGSGLGVSMSQCSSRRVGSVWWMVIQATGVRSAGPHKSQPGELKTVAAGGKRTGRGHKRV